MCVNIAQHQPRLLNDWRYYIIIQHYQCESQRFPKMVKIHSSSKLYVLEDFYLN